MLKTVVIEGGLGQLTKEITDVENSSDRNNCIEMDPGFGTRG
jgi:hypothetical protein